MGGGPCVVFFLSLAPGRLSPCEHRKVFAAAATLPPPIPILCLPILHCTTPPPYHTPPSSTSLSHEGPDPGPCTALPSSFRVIQSGSKNKPVYPRPPNSPTHTHTHTPREEEEAHSPPVVR